MLVAIENKDRNGRLFLNQTKGFLSKRISKKKEKKNEDHKYPL
jgi:hypothetical protein